jgi:hypothetical protein
MDRKNLLMRLTLLILFIFGVNFLANKFHWYYSVWYFDIIMHFLGGFWVGLLYFYFFHPKKLNLQLIFSVLLLVLVVGVGWEVFEALVDKVVTQNPLNVIDTTSDIFFDLLGGTIATLYFSKKIMPSNENRLQ